MVPSSWELSRAGKENYNSRPSLRSRSSRWWPARRNLVRAATRGAYRAHRVIQVSSGGPGTDLFSGRWPARGGDHGGSSGLGAQEPAAPHRLRLPTSAGIAQRGLGSSFLQAAPSVQRRPLELVTRRPALVWFFSKRFLGVVASAVSPPQGTASLALWRFASHRCRLPGKWG